MLSDSDIDITAHLCPNTVHQQITIVLLESEVLIWLLNDEINSTSSSQILGNAWFVFCLILRQIGKKIQPTPPMFLHLNKVTEILKFIVVCQYDTVSFLKTCENMRKTKIGFHFCNLISGGERQEPTPQQMCNDMLERGSIFQDASPTAFLHQDEWLIY